MLDQDEHAIISAVRQGDRERFGVLVERHQDTLYGVLVRMLADPVVADELAQEAFLRAYSRLDSFRAESRFSTWLVQIGIHLARDEIRRRQRRRNSVSLDQRLLEQGARAEPVCKGPEADPLARLCLREREQHLLAALGRLPVPYREVLALRYFSDWSFAEIADLTGDSVGTLKVRAHRARTMLRDALLAEEPELVATRGVAAPPAGGGGMRR
jgi:RNA polymerase sigma-70 factor (ECF subfamily)